MRNQTGMCTIIILRISIETFQGLLSGSYSSGNLNACMTLTKVRHQHCTFLDAEIIYMWLFNSQDLANFCDSALDHHIYFCQAIGIDSLQNQAPGVATSTCINDIVLLTTPEIMENEMFAAMMAAVQSDNSKLFNHL